jgi:predicted protein tyrosine phosphatase
MIASIVITDLNKATDLPYKTTILQDVWISAVDPEDKPRVFRLGQRLQRKGISHFAQYFRDWSDEDEEPFIKSNIEEQGPREQHINNIISFLDPFVASPAYHNLGVNCFAGIARSSAIAIIAWVMQGFSVEEALQKVLAVRKIAWPNLRMLKLASPRLGKNVMTAVADWKIKEQGNIVRGT